MNEHFFKLIVESSFDGIIITDSEGIILYANPRWFAMSGWSAEEVVGKVTPRIIKSGVKDQQFYATLWATIKRGEIFRFDITNKRKDGTLYDVEEVIIPIKKENTVIGFLDFSRDSIERKQYEEKLKKSEERFRNLTGSIIDAVVSADEKGKIVFWNQSAERMFGYRNDEVLGKAFTTIMPRRYHEAHRNDMARILSGGESHFIGKTTEMVGLKKTGQEFPIEISLAMFKNYEIIFTAVIRDITERKLTEQELQKQTKELEDAQRALVNVLEDVKKDDLQLEEERNKLQTTLESIGDGAFSVDASGKIVFFNKVAEEISGYKTIEVIGKQYRSALRFILEKDDSENYTFIEEVFAKGIISRIGNNTVLLTKEGDRVPVEDSAAPLKDADGKVVGAVVVFRDVTKARELEKTKTNFISVASHQLRTPLSALHWIAELFLSGDLGTLTNEQKSFLGDIYKSTRRLLDLVNMLLMSSRVEEGRVDIKPVPTDIVALTKECIAGLQALIKAKNLHLTVAVQPIAKINLEPEMFRQVILNLVSNAINYTPDGGRIFVQFALKPDLVICSVSDTGIGIPKKNQQRIFEKFFRSDNAIAAVPDGSGLGLNLARSIVATWGGSMRFESEEGKGTTFYFTVPLAGIKPRSGDVTINA